MAEWDTQNLLQYRDEIIGIFGIIIGVVVSIVTYLKTRRHIGASYYISTDRLIGPMGPRFLGLEILYDGKKVSSFSSSKIFIWNRGTDAIRAGDIAPSWPLKIILSDSNCVLDHRTLYCSSMHSKLSTTLEDDGQIAISFDYLDPKQGAVLEVLHTGEGGPLYLTGSIIGGGEIKLRKNPSGRAELLGFLTIMLVTMSIGIGMTWLMVFAYEGFFADRISFPFNILMLIMALAPMLVAMVNFDRWSSGGFMVKRLLDGYAKQEREAPHGAAPP